MNNFIFFVFSVFFSTFSFADPHVLPGGSVFSNREEDPLERAMVSVDGAVEPAEGEAPASIPPALQPGLGLALDLELLGPGATATADIDGVVTLNTEAPFVPSPIPETSPAQVVLVETAATALNNPRGTELFQQAVINENPADFIAALFLGVDFEELSRVNLNGLPVSLQSYEGINLVAALNEICAIHLFGFLDGV